MFGHLFIYRLKCMARDKTLIFWTLLYPIVMGTFFFFAFGHLAKEGEFKPIRVAVVDSAAYQADIPLRSMLDALSKPGKSQLLDIRVSKAEAAEELLEEGDVDGIINVQGAIGLIVRESGLNQSVLKDVLDGYVQTSSTATRILRQNPAAGPGLFSDLQRHTHCTVQTSFSDAPPNNVLNYFYALIAMTCMFGSFLGFKNATQTQANLSDQALRRSVAPTHKLAVILSDTAASLVIAVTEVWMLLAYLAFVLGVDFGPEIGYILLTGVIGSLAGVSWGTFIGSLLRLSEGAKMGILIAANLFLSFLAGLMFVNIKDIIAHKFPALSYINPVALITDALYSLYIFEGHGRFFLNMGLLGLITLILFAAGYLKMRGERYASL